MKSKFKFTIAPFLLICCFLTACANQHSAQPVITNMENNTKQTTPVAPNPPTDSLEVATLGGGCFWCLEAVYQSLEGVVKVESGYTGGSVKNPSYKEVCTGRTGHAEVVQVTFNPAAITYQDIIDIFWHIHDPTTLNRQGNDVGTQYRSAVFYHSAAQQAIAQQSKDEAQIKGTWLSPIVTEIVPFTVFYKAEDYHQNYYKDNPNQPYCSIVIAPKVKKFRQQYQEKLKQ